jgi:hypothetical protein
VTILIDQLIRAVTKGAKVVFYQRSDTALKFFCDIQPNDDARATSNTSYLGAGSTPTEAIKNAVALMIKRGAA